MEKNKPTYELNTDLDLSKFLLGAIRDVRKNELDIERATVISQLADKYTKNEIMRCLKAKIERSGDVDGQINKALMISSNLSQDEKEPA